MGNQEKNLRGRTNNTNTNQEENLRFLASGFHPPISTTTTTTTTLPSMSEYHHNLNLHSLLRHQHHHPLNTHYPSHTTPSLESSFNRLNLNLNPNTTTTTLPNHLPNNINNFPSYQSSTSSLSSYQSLPTTPLYYPRTDPPSEYSFDQAIPPPVLPLSPYDSYDLSSLIRRIQIQDSIIRKMLTENSLATNPYTPARTNNQLLINRPVGSVVNNASLPGSTRFSRSGLLGGGGGWGGGSMDLGLGIEYNKLDYMRLEDLKGKIAALAKVQHGCKFLQDKIDEGRYEDVNTIFDEVKEFMSELMVDQFGNYMVQNLFELLNEQQLNEILCSVTRTDCVLAKICQNIHGTRVMQKLLARLSTSHQIAIIVNALIPVTVHLTKDMYGHHVIQHCVKHFSIEYTQYLLEAVTANCVNIATDCNGCCVLQTCVDHAQGEIMEHILTEIIRNALVLANDPYGNYVVQHILEKKIPHATSKLLKKFEGKFASLSTQKFSSNVVEKCLKESNHEQCMMIIEELVDGKDILLLLQDAFGNYVIQTALEEAYKMPIFNFMFDRIKMHYSSLRSHPHGKRILIKLDSFKKQ